MGIRSQEYKDFSLRFHLKGASRPLVGQFELTHRCNLRCQHCYIVNDPTKEELNYYQLCSIFDQVYQQGCLWLCLSGGEPLLREDFLNIYSYIYKKGFIIGIFSNATVFTEELVKYLQRFPPFFIEVTFNGVTKKTYELITQTAGSFDQALKGIELIRKYDLPLRLKCQAMTLNTDELPLLRKFYQELGMAFNCAVVIDPRMDGSSQPCSLRLAPEEVSELTRRGEVVKGRGELEDNFVQKEPPADGLFRCPGGTWAFYINPFGELFFCNSLRKPSWDLGKHPFREGFYEFFSQIRARRFVSDSLCRSCALWRLCLRCPGKAELECGDAEAAIEYYCRLAHLSVKEKQKSPSFADKAN